MGTVYYGGEATPIEIEDRTLAHLKVVIATKLRRGESFTLSWQHPEGQPRGRSTLWLHPSIPLRFVFDDPEPTELSRHWLEDLASSAHSSGGIQLVAEHFDVSTGPVPIPEPSDERGPADKSEPVDKTRPAHKTQPADKTRPAHKTQPADKTNPPHKAQRDVPTPVGG